MPLAPFTVPFGLDPAGAIVPIEEADPTVRYCCPGCLSPLILKAGVIVRHHFAHKPDANCTPESALHEATKRRIADAVRAWRTGGGPRPVVRWRCTQCHAMIERPLTERATSAVVEWRHESGRVIDVAVLDAQGDALLGVEVLVTHRVDEEKEVALGGMTWIELAAARLHDPAVWMPQRAGGRLSPGACDDCRERPLRRRRETVDIAARYGIPEPPQGYFAIEVDCWKCHRRMPLFFWPGIGVGRPAPEPWPRTVKVRYSRTVEARYLSNGCVHCDALQGDFFLQGQLFNAVGNDPDAIELQELFFTPESEEEWERSARGLTIEEMVNIVVPPARRLPW